MDALWHPWKTTARFLRRHSQREKSGSSIKAASSRERLDLPGWDHLPA